MLNFTRPSTHRTSTRISLLLLNRTQVAFHKSLSIFGCSMVPIKLGEPHTSSTHRISTCNSQRILGGQNTSRLPHDGPSNRSKSGACSQMKIPKDHNYYPPPSSPSTWVEKPIDSSSLHIDEVQFHAIADVLKDVRPVFSGRSFFGLNVVSTYMLPERTYVFLAHRRKLTGTQRY